MNIKIKKMETDEEIRGKAYVHWKSWHEAFTGLIENKYIDGLTIEKCEELASRWPENILMAKDVSSKLMQAGLEHIRDYPINCLWGLKNNARAIRFYQKCGFQFDGTEIVSSNLSPAIEVRMVLAK